MVLLVEKRMSRQYRILTGPHHVKTMTCCGIPKDHAEKLQGQIGVACERKLSGYEQIMFNGAILGTADFFCYCIPNDCLEAVR
jgi:hypothetical protein